MLPEKVLNFDQHLIKRVVSQERFEELVQNAFDHFDRFFVGHQAHFENWFEEWKADEAPADAEPVS
jgi:hypothetical protein